MSLCWEPVNVSRRQVSEGRCLFFPWLSVMHDSVHRAHTCGGMPAWFRGMIRSVFVRLYPAEPGSVVHGFGQTLNRRREFRNDARGSHTESLWVRHTFPRYRGIG